MQYLAPAAADQLSEWTYPVVFHAGRVWAINGHTLMVTSIVTGDHGPVSFHYNYRAIDLRIHDIPQLMRPGVVRDLAAHLGRPYQVIWEDQGKPNEHVHVEFDDGTTPPGRRSERQGVEKDGKA